MAESSPLVVLRAPRVGLANMLITWGRAVAFAALNDRQWKSYGWSSFRPGPWLRGERVKRRYAGMFNANLSWLQIASIELSIRNGRAVSFDPELKPLDEDRIAIFQKFPKGPNFFDGLHPHSTLIRNEFPGLLTPKVHRSLNDQAEVAIACHVRRGDFIRETDSRYSPGGEYCQTPLHFFIDSIDAIRKKTLSDLPVTVFTDGHPQELAPLLSLPHVTMARNNSDIVDLVRLSRAEFLVTSAWSSFSYLAGFLGESTMLRYPYQQSRRIRPEGSACFEGTLEQYLSGQQLGKVAA